MENEPSVKIKTQENKLLGLSCLFSCNKLVAKAIILLQILWSFVI
jgi:hypothetical protein